MGPAAVAKEVSDAIVRGRGGAGFPMGTKWGFVPRDTGKPVYLVCNADEGEPGTFKDRQIMEFDPHLLIEGMAISGLAIGAELGFIYIRGEFEWIAGILEGPERKHLDRPGRRLRLLPATDRDPLSAEPGRDAGDTHHAEFPLQRRAATLRDGHLRSYDQV
jgi:hypothetical protein